MKDSGGHADTNREKWHKGKKSRIGEGGRSQRALIAIEAFDRKEPEMGKTPKSWRSCVLCFNAFFREELVNPLVDFPEPGPEILSHVIAT